jgi:hypothetical protein
MSHFALARQSLTGWQAQSTVAFQDAFAKLEATIPERPSKRADFPNKVPVNHSFSFGLRLNVFKRGLARAG